MEDFYGKKYTIEYSTASWNPPPEIRYITPKYTCQIKLKSIRHNPPLKKDGKTIYESWDYSLEKSYKWLVEHCEDWRWDINYSIEEDDNGCLTVEIFFYGDDEIATAFKLRWL